MGYKSWFAGVGAIGIVLLLDHHGEQTVIYSGDHPHSEMHQSTSLEQAVTFGTGSQNGTAAPLSIY